MKKLLTLCCLVLSLSLGATFATAQSATAPKSVIHIVTVAFKADAKPEQIKAALDGAHKLPSQYPGITRVWTRAIKIQDAPGAEKKKTNVIVMEFASEKALADYTDSAAQKAWYALYTPIREVSTTFDVTN